MQLVFLLFDDILKFHNLVFKFPQVVLVLVAVVMLTFNLVVQFLFFLWYKINLLAIFPIILV